MASKKVVKKKIRGIKALIAEGLELDFHVKEQTKRLNAIKEKVRQHAAYIGKGLIDGDYGSCVFVEDTTTTKIDIDDYFQFLFLEEDRPDDFLDSVTVSITKAKQILTEEEFDRISTKVKNKYHRVTFGEVETSEDKVLS